MAESNSDPNESIPMRIPTSKSRGVVSALAALGAVAVVAVPAATSATAAPNHAATHHGVKPLHAGVRPAATRATSQYTLSLQTSMTHGAVSPAPKVYLVFWGKQWSSDKAGVANDLQGMFKGLYGSKYTWGTILDQYCEGLSADTTNCGSSGTHVTHPTASPLAGVWFDNAANEPS